MNLQSLPPSEVSFAFQTSDLLASLRAAWAPRPNESVSEIAEQHLYLSPEYSKVQGHPDFDAYPYLIEPANRMSPDDPCNVMAFRGPIQGGKTMILQAVLTYIITSCPGPTLFVTDTETKAELFSKKRFDLMTRDSPRLRELVADAKSRDKGNTILRKTFRGGDVDFVGAHSASRLTSNSYRWVLIDEADDHAENVGKAGSSISLAMGRQTSFGDLAKTCIVSSPKVKGTSEIDHWYGRGDQRAFHVPCPRCGEKQPLEFRSQNPDTGAWEYRLVWPKGHPDEAHYVCRHCKATWENRDKNLFLRHGLWVPTRPDLGEGGTITSYGLNCLYLPVGSYSWVDLARQWESAIERMRVGDLDEHRAVINTRLAESYDLPGDTIDAHSLPVDPDWSEAPERIPAGVRCITCGTDVHPERIETITVGWGTGWEAWILDYTVTLGEPSDKGDKCWAAHDEIVRRVYTTEDGRKLRAAATCVDRGHLSDTVLAYCAPRFQWGVYAVKAIDGTPKDAIWDKKVRRASRNKARNTTYYSIRVVPAKDYLQNALKVTEAGPKHIHIPARIEKEIPDFRRQLAAERRILARDNKGRPHVEWKKVDENRRNEVWDTLVYSLAAMHSLSLGGLRLDAAPRTTATKPPAPGPSTSTTTPEHSEPDSTEPGHGSRPPRQPRNPGPRGAPRPGRNDWLGRGPRGGRWL